MHRGAQGAGGKYVLVFGEQRSGTTLLMGLLGAQEGVHVVQPGFPLYTAVRELGLAPDQSLSHRQTHVLWRQARQRCPEALPADRPVGLGTYRAMLRHIMALEGDAPVRCAKFHGPFEAVAPLLDGAEDFVCVHLQRDVRDVLLSRAYRGDAALDEPALHWLRSSASMRRLQTHPRLVTLRFEDLIAQPAAELERVGRRLGLEFAAALQADERGRARLQNSSFDELVPFDKRAVGRYKRNLERPLLSYVQWLCRSEIEAWGYPIEECLNPPLPTRIAYARRVAALHLLDAPRRIKNFTLARLLPSLVD